MCEVGFRACRAGRHLAIGGILHVGHREVHAVFTVVHLAFRNVLVGTRNAHKAGSQSQQQG